MAIYQYKAISPTGESLQGQMEATSEAEVISRLQESGNLPLSADEAGQGISLNLGALFGGQRKVSQRQIGDITSQLATLLSAGLPLDRALQVLADLAEGDVVERLVGALRDQVRGGTSLSEALESQHGVFSKLYVNMVRAGEAGGTLDQALERLADYLERSKALRDSVISALIYPVMLLTLAIASLFILLTYVVPQFMPIFEEMGGELPFITKIVLGAGEVLQSYWWAIVGVILLCIIFMQRQLAQTASRYVWDGRFLNMRGVGGLICKVEMARLSRTVGTLLVNGVPLLAALSIGKRVMGNTVLAEGVEQAAEEVKTGGSLARTLAANGHFPKLALQMISVGEETGKLDEMLVRVADAYDVEVKTTIDRLMALLVPLLTLGLAVLIATIVISILMAIMGVNDLVV